jgi:hypothetical protein
MFQGYKPSSGINSKYGQVMVDVLRMYGKISRTQNSRLSEDLFHIKY